MKNKGFLLFINIIIMLSLIYPLVDILSNIMHLNTVNISALTLVLIIGWLFIGVIASAITFVVLWDYFFYED